MSKYSTRLLLSVTAVAVVCGILIAATGPLHGIALASFPAVYGALIGIYFLPAAICIPLFRTPGIGILATALTGLIVSVSPFNNRGIMALVYVVSVGALQELPYFIGRYRSWSVWVQILGAFLAGLIMAFAFDFVFSLDTFPTWARILQFVLSILVPVIVVIIGNSIAKALQAAGIGEKKAR